MNYFELCKHVKDTIESVLNIEVDYKILMNDKAIKVKEDENYLQVYFHYENDEKTIYINIPGLKRIITSRIENHDLYFNNNNNDV